MTDGPLANDTMMTWLAGWLFNPALALGGAAVASPILIHLLSRRRFRRVRWAAMDFLLEAQRRNRRRVRLEQLILLIVRCLILVLLALMVARPFVRPGAVAALVGAAPRTERIILLDDSFSMGYRVGAGQTVFDRGRSAVLQIARWIGNERPGDTLLLLLMSDAGRPVTTLPDLSESNLALLETRLTELQPGHGAGKINDALRTLANVIEHSPTQVNTTVYVVSDFQRRDWLSGVAPKEPPAHPVSNDRRASVIAPLANVISDQQTIELSLVDVGADNPANLAITAIEPAQPQIAANVRSRFEVAVSNFGDVPASEVELAVSISDQALPPVILQRIEPYETLREPIEVAFHRSGADRLMVELSGVEGMDRLSLDNRRALGIEVVPAVSVLLVNGEPSNDPYRDEVFLLKTALAPPGQVCSGNDIRVVDDEQFDAQELRPFHAVILANVYRLTETARRRLAGYVEDGGGLVVFLGDQVDVGAWNEMLVDSVPGRQRGTGLWLPAELGEVVQTPSGGRGVGIGWWDAAHPLFRPFISGGGELLRGPRFYAFVVVTPDAEVVGGDGRTLSDPAENEDADQPERASVPDESGTARVLATLDDPDRSPLLVERRLGRGRVLLWSSSADLEWNDWARDPSYVATMLQMVQYVARPAAESGDVIVGSPIRLAVDPNEHSTRAVLRLPTYPDDAPISIEARALGVTDALLPISGDAGAGFYFLWERTERAGLYQIDLGGPGGTDTGQSSPGGASRFIAVNPDPAESDLSRVSQSELRETLHEMPFNYVRDVSVYQEETSEARQELWWPIFIGVAMLLLVEHAMAWWFGTRG
jgi:hypothetical protein